MVNSITEPLGMSPWAEVWGGISWVGPRMKLPSTFAGGIEPSGSSLAVTQPGVLGSRVGGARRSVGCGEGGDWAETGLETAARLTRRQMRREREVSVISLFCSIRSSGERSSGRPPAQITAQSVDDACATGYRAQTSGRKH